VVGGLGVVVTDGGTNLLREAAGLGWRPASVIATVAAIAVTFVGSQYWTFRHRQRTSLPRETLLFLGLAGVGLLIQLGCLRFTVHVLGESGRLAANLGLGTGIVLATVFRFFAYRRWVWRAAEGGTVVGVDQADHEVGDRALRADPIDEAPAFAVFDRSLASSRKDVAAAGRCGRNWQACLWTRWTNQRPSSCGGTRSLWPGERP
jgi:putative flippase GtrA